MKTYLVTKPGWQTTEFWLALVPLMLIVLGVLGVDVAPEEVSGWVYAAAGVVAGAYALGRSIVKAFRASNPNVIIIDPKSQKKMGPARSSAKKVTTDV